jgi:phage gp36-like protein
MPAYAALSDLLQRVEERELVQLTDDDGAGTADVARIEAACDRATGVIDSYLAAIYQLPLTTVPAILVELTCALARQFLWQAKGTPPEGVDKAAAAATRTLEKIASGTLKIDAGSREQPAREGAIVVDGGKRVFGRDKMVGF